MCKHFRCSNNVLQLKHIMFVKNKTHARACSNKCVVYVYIFPFSGDLHNLFIHLYIYKYYLFPFYKVKNYI